ncbi:MAG: hypothetical protein RLZZ04_228 [Cyanobacteriota bacterium]|jgi:hypothetical protein
MSDCSNSLKKTVNPKYTSESETNRVLDVFGGLKKDAEKTKTFSEEENTDDLHPVLTMTSIGQLGRFGNQLFQYACLRICAEKSGAKVECPPWIGQTLFGHTDAPISQRLSPAVELKDEGESLFDIIPEFIPYLEKLADAKSTRISSKILTQGLANADLWGFFQFHTRHLKPYRQYFCSLFQPVDELKSALEDGLNTLRSQGKTMVGVHVRRGDYITEPRVGFTLVFPPKWYCAWLENIWDELEKPVLLLCSDDVDSIVDEFAKFNPITSKDLNIKLPARFEDLELEFYSDFFMLSNCDVVVTSNSNFSFVACMLNERAKMFVRPDWDFSKKFQEFNPWDSEPLLWLGGDQSKFVKSLSDSLSITYKTQGFWAVLKCLFIYLPQNYIKGWAIRAYLGYQTKGILGVIQSLSYILGLRSVRKRCDRY